jgi:hypothetical protein
VLEKLLAKRHIQNLDFSSVRAKLQEKLGWSADQAQRVEGDYKRFLYALAHKRHDDILSPPTQEVDEFWHQHILDTRRYRDDCQTIFGHYVDHTPGLKADKQRQADQRRQEVYQDYDIDTISFDAPDSFDSRHDGGAVSSHFHLSHSHGSHGHDTGSAHGDAGSSSHGDGGAHGGDGAGGDSGGGGDTGGGCGGSGCGGGGCSGG